MIVRFLGTGTSSGVPLIGCQCEVCTSTDTHDKRLRSSVLVELEGKTIIIDCGPDFRQQMLREDVRQLDAILMTHSHKDHTGGLDDIRAYNFILKRDMHVYLDSYTELVIRTHYDYIFAKDPYPGIPRVQLHNIGNAPFMVDGIEIIPIQVYHHKMPVFGFRIGDFTYITDANRIDEAEKEKVKGSKVLVLNALRREAHISHFTLSEALALVDELKPDRTYLTHISHQLGRYAEVSKELPYNVFLAFDGLKVEL